VGVGVKGKKEKKKKITTFIPADGRRSELVTGPGVLLGQATRHSPKAYHSIRKLRRNDENRIDTNNVQIWWHRLHRSKKISTTCCLSRKEDRNELFVFNARKNGWRGEGEGTMKAGNEKYMNKVKNDENGRQCLNTGAKYKTL
jgi:hypothetical protein